MQIASTIDPIAALRAQARWQRDRPLPARLWRSLADGWLRTMERRVASDVHWLDHEGVEEDFRRASRG